MEKHYSKAPDRIYFGAMELTVEEVVNLYEEGFIFPVTNGSIPCFYQDKENGANE